MSASVLHLIPQLSPGGAGRAALTTATSSSRHSDLEHRVASLRPSYRGMRATAAARDIEVIDAGSVEQAIEAMAAADLVHLHFWSSPELNELLEAELPPTRLLLWPHVAGHTPPQLLPRELVEAADLAIASSELAASSISGRGAKAGRDTPRAAAAPEVIPPVGGWERIGEVRRSPREGFNVGYLGTVGSVKLHPDFAAACADVRVPEARFIVCGWGDAVRALPRQAAELGLAERFELRPPLERIGALLADLDVFGYPLRKDTSSSSELALKEAMYAGVPPVVLPHGGADQLVEDGQTGVVAPDLDSYARAIERLHADPGERKRLSENAREHARRRWDPAVVGPRWAAAYERLLSVPKSSRPPVLTAPRDREHAGASRFIRGLGAHGEILRMSIAGTEAEERAADRWIAACSPVVGLSDGGLIDHRRRYPDDPLLALWAGIFLRAQGRPALSAGQLTDARRLGCSPRRLAPHLSEAAAAAVTLTREAVRP